MSLFFSVLLLFSATAFGETVEFPTEELANESVLPVFEEPEAVKNRSVLVAEKFEVGVVGAADLSEPFFGAFGFGGSLAYNFNEEQGLYFLFNYRMKRDSTYVAQLLEEGLVLEGAPRMEYLALANYQYSPFYGKLSLTKQTVSNFHLFLTGGGGFASIGGEMNPVLSLGIGQKFYFSPTFAVRFDLRGLFFNGPDPLSVEITEDGEIPPTAEFEKRMFINTFLTASFVFVL